MKRRILTMLLAAALLGSLLPQFTLPVHADASGECGEHVSWYYDEQNNTLTVSGSGPMADWTGTGWHWEGVPESIGTLVIEDGVTRIGDYAFPAMEFEEIAIPDSVEEIGAGAFWAAGSERLDITIPETVTSIGDYAFAYAVWGNLYDHAHEAEVGQNVFYRCDAMNGTWVDASDKHFKSDAYGTLYQGRTLLRFPRNYEGPLNMFGYGTMLGATAIADGAFANCTGLTYLNLTDFDVSDLVASIGADAFSGCVELQEVTIPRCLQTVSEGMFADCSNLTAAILPKSVGQVCANAFSGCGSLTEVMILNPECEIAPDAGTLSSPDYTVIYGYDRSTAQAYAEQYGYGFVSLSNEGEPWELDEDTGVLTIRSDEGMRSWIAEKGPYISAVREVRLLEGVTTLPTNQYVFKDCTALTAISIPSSLESFGDNVFDGCTALAAIDVDPLNPYFSGEDGVLFNKSKTTLYFCSAEKTGTYTVPDTVQVIGYSAFGNCTGLTDITLQEGLLYVDHFAFSGCTGLTELLLPSSVRGFSSEPVMGCKNLTAINVDPNNAYYTGVNGVLYTKDMTTLVRYPQGKPGASYTIPNGVTSIGIDAFLACGSLTEISIPDSVTKIGSMAFGGCTGLTQVTIPDGVTVISSSTFDGCSGLTSVTIPGSVTQIYQYAFMECSNLTSVTIPESVTSISTEAFRLCSRLAEITILNPDCTIAQNVYTLGSKTNTTICGYPDSTAEAYAQTYGYSFVALGSPVGNTVSGQLGANLSWSLDRETGVLTISGEGPMEDFVPRRGGDPAPWGEYASEITEAVIEDGVTSIGDYAFAGCVNLASVTIPDSVASIGENAFSGCNALTELVIPNPACSFPELLGLPDTAAIRGYAGSTAQACAEANGYTFVPLEGTPARSWYFNEETNLLVVCSDEIMTDWSSRNPPPWYYYDEDGLIHYNYDIQAVLILDGVTRIGSASFYDCKLKSVTIPDSVTSIGNGAFMDSSLRSVTIPDSVTTIGEYAFEYARSLSSVTIPEGVTSIGRSAFYGCWSLTSLSIPASVTQIGDEAFAKCDRLTSLNVASGNPSFSSLNGVLFNKDRTALLACPAGKSGAYQIPDGVTYIGRAAFCGCEKLTDISIPDSVTEIGMGAFSNCTHVRSLTIPEGVTEISDSAFWFCSRATSITIPEGVTSIGSDSFAGCQELTSMTIPASVASIGMYAFEGTYNLTQIVVLNPGCVIYQQVGTLGQFKTTTIYGYTGSTAQGYAGAYGYAFMPLESAQYQVHFDANGGEGEMDDLPMDYGVSAALTPNAFTRTGCTFIGWNTAADGSGTAYSDGETVGNLAVEGTVTLYAQWQAKPAPQYSIAWSFGGSVPTVTVTLTWSDGEMKAVPAEVTASQTEDSVTYTACAEFNGVSYESSRTVQRSYAVQVVNGTVTSGQKDSYSYGDQIIVTAGPAPEGQAFAGWRLDGELVSTSEVYGRSVDRSFILEATYTDQPVEVKPVVSASAAPRVYVASTGKYKTTLSASWSVPKGYKLVEAGVIRAYGTAEPSLDALVSDGTKKASTLKNANGTYNLGLTMAASKKDSSLYYVGYLTCKSSDGKTVTIYTDIGCNEPVRD